MKGELEKQTSTLMTIVSILKTDYSTSTKLTEGTDPPTVANKMDSVSV